MAVDKNLVECRALSFERAVRKDLLLDWAVVDWVRVQQRKGEKGREPGMGGMSQVAQAFC